MGCRYYYVDIRYIGINMPKYTIENCKVHKNDSTCKTMIVDDNTIIIIVFHVIMMTN